MRGEKFTVCLECEMVFRAVTDAGTKYPSYCPTHRKPLIERDRRKRELIEWTVNHLDLVEKLKAKQDKKEAAQRKKAQVDTLSGLGLNLHGYSSLAAQQNMDWNTWDSAFGRYRR